MRCPLWRLHIGGSRFFAVLSLVAVLCAAPDARSQQTVNADASLPARTISVADLLRWYDQQDQGWLGGSQPISNGAPAVGFARIQRGAETEYCGATLIASRFAVTAGHCVCFADANYGACQSNLANVAISFFLPAAGVYASEGAPVVHPAYQRPSRLPPAVLGDIAVFRLDRDVTSVAPLALAQAPPRDSDLLAFVSFGPYTPTADFANVLVGEATYERGFGHMSRVAFHKFNSGCDRINILVEGRPRTLTGARDEVCVRYNPDFDAPGSPEQDFLMCHSDSGGALIARGGDRSIRLIGVASFITHDNDCEPHSSGASFFVDIPRYRNWIGSVVGPLPAASVPARSCVEMILAGAGRFRTEFEVDFVSVSVTARRGAPAPDFAIDAGAGAHCSEDALHRFGACELAAPQAVTVQVREPETRAQVLLCPTLLRSEP